ncbi:MAG: PspA/IM30 family protein [Gammaproteobacteria bacterium]|nr:PspA/IM30 family protein [Gammaproteobacteria bacterium]
MSNLFKRINDVINSNINDLIDKVEDPERMIKQIIREMEENVRYSKEGVVSAISSEKQLFRELELHRVECEKWQHKAEVAMKNANEELARGALGQKKEHEAIVNRIEPMWRAASRTSSDLKYQLQQLEDKLQDARRKRGSLSARQRAAKTQEYMLNTGSDFDAHLLAQDNFNRMENKVIEMEARAQACSELDAVNGFQEGIYIEMEREADINAEMDELKKRFEA